ncbi:hypothetical protein NBO_6g0017 [Nosema bombycis CQ1]|uniref:Uncharacterized protein n=1 Tax=Nosema bombycis (strain CQ1 / CVCC 102059) TaxID=578461 RepID=R0MLZ8_NOSB1|nr:hypothetical protein NBO_6g0017 [Nosema bombycis CQ1]|eukprot:EOB15265.1 hypothetical protein NBO_6g0017 [Nosema bombycis CQ1]
MRKSEDDRIKLHRRATPLFSFEMIHRIIRMLIFGLLLIISYAIGFVLSLFIYLILFLCRVLYLI